MKNINKKLEYNTELMLITMEECGELIEACSKAVRCEDYTIDKLTEEAGDVLCMIELMKKKGILCLLYTSPSPRDRTRSRMPSSA